MRRNRIWACLVGLVLAPLCSGFAYSETFFFSDYETAYERVEQSSCSDLETQLSDKKLERLLLGNRLLGIDLNFFGKWNQSFESSGEAVFEGRYGGVRQLFRFVDNQLCLSDLKNPEHCVILLPCKNEPGLFLQRSIGGDDQSIVAVVSDKNTADSSTTKTQATDCSKIENDIARLDCFDKATKSNNSVTSRLEPSDFDDFLDLVNFQDIYTYKGLFPKDCMVEFQRFHPDGRMLLQTVIDLRDLDIENSGKVQVKGGQYVDFVAHRGSQNYYAAVGWDPLNLPGRNAGPTYLRSIKLRIVQHVYDIEDAVRFLLARATECQS